MALREKDVQRELAWGSLRKLIAQVEATLNSSIKRTREKFPLSPLVETAKIGRVPRQRGKTETGECPVYSGEDEYTGNTVGEEDAEEGQRVEIAAKVRFPEKKAGWEG